jgi:hypothetical protein
VTAVGWTVEETPVSTEDPEPLDLEKMGSIVHQMVDLLIEMRRDLSPYMTNLTPEQRKSLPKAPLKLDDVGQRLASTSPTVPHLLAVCPNFHGPTVQRQLDIGRILGPLAEHAEMIAQLAADTRNKHMSDAYVATLELYRIGKAMGETDAQVREVIEPMAELFAARVKKAKKEEGSE